MLEEFRLVYYKDNVLERIDGLIDMFFVDLDIFGVYENVLEILFYEDYVGLGGFLKGIVCLYMGIRKLKNLIERV